MKYEKIDYNKKLPFTYHLGEIRYRLVRIIVMLFILFVICFALSETFLEIIRAPIKGYDLIFIAPAEAFFVHLKLGFFAAIAFCTPFILYHLWLFISPGLKEKERKYTLPFVLSSTLFFVLGILFAYYIILPLGFPILLNYKTGGIKAFLTISNYTTFTTQTLLVFGLIFELPLITLFLTKLGILKPAILSKNRKYAFLIIFIISAILTPPDVVTQVLMAIPLIILYELSILGSKFVYMKKAASEANV